MKKDVQHFFNEHRAECICGGIAIGVLLLNVGSIREFIESSHQLRESMKAEQANNQRLQVDQLVSEQRREVADDRYRNSCTVIFSLNQTNHYTAISEGDPILKGELAPQYRGKNLDIRTMPRSAFLPAGMTVCDVYGNTAKLVTNSNLNGLAVARDLANTGDPALIKSAMERAKGIYSNPVK